MSKELTCEDVGCTCAEAAFKVAPEHAVGSRAWLLERLEVMTREMLATARAKNADYAGATDEAFGNFTRVEDLGICSTEVGFLTRMSDKLCRVASLTKSGNAQVKSESVRDTLLDLANYSMLMAAFLEYKAAQGGLGIGDDEPYDATLDAVTTPPKRRVTPKRVP